MHEATRFRAVNADHHEVKPIKLLGSAEIFDDGFHSQRGVFVVQTLGDGGDLGRTNVVCTVALMTQIGRFDDIGVHQGDAALQVDPAQGRNQKFSQLGADASSTDQKQIAWALLIVYKREDDQAYLKNLKNERNTPH